MAIQNLGGLTKPEVDQVARNYSVVDLNFSDAGGDWIYQATDARRLVNANPSIRVFSYFRLSYVSAAMESSRGSSSHTYPEAWYLHDTKGHRVQFDSHQWFVNVANPNYRAYALAATRSWMRIALWAGIKFDTTRYLIGALPPNGGMYGKTSLNDVVCGPWRWDTTLLDCPVVVAWNQGLRDQIKIESQSFHRAHLQVLFNGFAPRQTKQVNGRDVASSRMLGLLAQPVSSGGVDGALDESFCIQVAQAGAPGASLTKFVDMAADLRILTASTYRSKLLLPQTNYQTTDKLALAPRCIANFLMGWQPGHSFYRFGASYDSSQLAAQPDPAVQVLPHNGIDEMDLDLGNPVGAATAQGNVLERQFDHGYVLVNDGASQTVTLPNVQLVRFSGGVQRRTLRAGQTLPLHPGEAVFLLSGNYLRSLVSGTSTAKP